MLLTVLDGTTQRWQAKRREVTRREILAAAWDAAQERGLAALTLRDVADRVGMRPPSLYSHFASKHAIYDAMFAEAWTTYVEVIEGLVLPAHPRAALRLIATTFFDFSAADLARHQLMNMRTIPDFTPSPESYAPAVRVFERLRELLAGIGVHDDADVDLFTALVGGLINQQWANEPGGARWARLVERAVDMYATELGLPQEER